MAITATELTTAMVKQDLMWADSQRKQDYEANAVAANALIENTTAKLDVIQDTSNMKKRKVKIYWNDVCDPTVATTTPDYCSITGTAPNSNALEYDITKKVSSKFTIDEALYTTNMMTIEEVFADTLLKHMKALDEKVAQVSVSSLDAFAQENALQSGLGCTDATGTWIETFINPSLWSPSIMGYLKRIAIKNKFGSPVLLDGSNLYDHYWNAQMNAGNSNGAGAKNMFDNSGIKLYFDLFNVDAVADKSSFLMNRGAVAFAHKAWWDSFSQNAPKVDSDGRRKFSIPSKNIAGLKYDVYITSDCSAQFEKHNVLLVAEYDILNGAPACDHATGVIKLTCGVCPTVTP